MPHLVELLIYTTLSNEILKEQLFIMEHQNSNEEFEISVQRVEIASKPKSNVLMQSSLAKDS